jgi:ribonuclease-3
LLKLALTHRSYLHVTGQGPRESNERLEFLGDSVLGLVTSEFLYRSHPGEHEGQLTKTKSLLVSKAILSRRALAMGLGRFVLMSHAEVESGGRQRLSILADAFESVIGAIYLDQGFEAAREFIDRWLLKESKVIAADRRHTNYKSHLQEYVQSTYRTHPVYRIRHEMGPDHSKQFMVEVMVGRRSLGEGRGQNKKEAEQAAARNALEAVESGPVSDREKRREERHVPREGVLPEPERGEAPARTAEPAGETDTDEGEDRGRRRRRGRRGGRGRLERGPDAAAGPAAAVRAREPERDREPRAEREREPRAERAPRGESTAPAARPSRFLRPEPGPGEREPSAMRPAELEPVPPAREEDENEEVGRPEGPLGERPAAPYAWEPRAVAVEPARAPVAVPEPLRPVAPSEPEPAFEPEFEPEFERPEEFAEAGPEEEAAPPAAETGLEPEAGSEARYEPAVTRDLEAEEDTGPRYPEVEPPPPAPAPPPAPSWGRRQRRGR